jgi:hypothetical protein
MPARLVILDMDGAGLFARVTFNGVPVAADTMYERLARAIKLNGWVVSGPNRLVVELGRLPPRVRQPGDIPLTPVGEPRFRLRLRSAILGADDESDRVLADYVWNRGTHPLAPAPRQVLSTVVDLQPARAYSWTRGRPVTAPGPHDRAGVEELLERMHAALTQKSVAELVRLQELALSEQAEALGEDPREMLGSYVEFLQSRMESDWSVEPLQKGALKMEPVADGRALHVTSGGGPALVTHSTEGSFALDPYVSDVEGRWIIVR